MAEALISAAAERIVALLAEQTRHHVNLIRGAEKEVRSLAQELETVKNVLNDAENRRFQDKNINTWLSRLEHASYEMEDVLDEWDYAILKLKMEGHRPHHDDPVAKKKVFSFVPKSSSFLFYKKAVVRHKIASKILNVKAQLDKILKEKDRYNFAISPPKANDHTLPESWRVQSTSSVDLGEIYGRDRDRDILISKLVDNSHEESGIPIVSIVGVGGLGKTTLAQLVYNHSRVDESFELKIWICVSHPFDLAAIAKGIYESIKKESCPNTNQLDVLFSLVKECISGKKFLLVLDDVWTQEYSKWEPLRNTLRSCGGAGSKILVTSRNERAVQMMGSRDSEICHLGRLPDDDCLLLLRRIALSERNEVGFEDISERIAQKCNGLPLAVKTLASVLRFKSSMEEWENVLNSEIWKLEVAEVDLFPHLFLSYNELSPSLKRCFSYLAFLPKDCKFVVEALIRDWMAVGYLGSSDNDEIELKGREHFNVLAMRSLFQDFVKDDMDEIEIFKMHDIVHDFAQFVRRQGRDELASTNKNACRVCDPLLVSMVNEFCTLHCEDETPPSLCDCLVRLRVLSIVRCGLESIPQGLEKLIHLRSLRLDRILDLSSDGLKTIFQLYNLQSLSLRNFKAEEIPREIENLIHLRRLDLSEIVSLEEFPKEIGNMIQLRYLSLISNSSLKKFPTEIGNLIQLRELDLSRNYMKELPREIGKLVHLRELDLRSNSLKELPAEIGNLIQLRRLYLNENRSLKELPKEIGNLVHLRVLGLKGTESLSELPSEIGNLTDLRKLIMDWNYSVKELPSEIGNLVQLRSLSLMENKSLMQLPESICGLQNLNSLKLSGCESLCVLPETLARLTGLRSLDVFRCGSGWSKFRILKNLNHVGGSLSLKIRLAGTDGHDLDEVVEDAREAELRSKVHIEEIQLAFNDNMDAENEESLSWRSRVRMSIIEALEPHPKLQSYCISDYKGFKFPSGWMVSPLNQVRLVYLIRCNRLTTLPCLAKLPCLEEAYIYSCDSLQFVGREFLGITTTTTATTGRVVAFPKLMFLQFEECSYWKEWEDITADDEEECAASLTLMPCLRQLKILKCNSLEALPERLLQKCSSMQNMDITDSEKLIQRYINNDDSS